jgi:hypothetical protein
LVFIKHFEAGINPDEFIREISSEGIFIAVNELRHQVHKNVIAKNGINEFFMSTILSFLTEGIALKLRA